MRNEVLTARLVPSTALTALLLLTANVWAQVPGEKTVGGIVFRIGIASGEQLSSHPPGHGEGRMHPSQSSRGRDHLTISLAEKGSGKRIEDATVTASVSRSGVDHVNRLLERMEMPGATSYGGFFDFRQPGPYRIRVEVARPGAPAPVAAEFDYGNR